MQKNLFVLILLCSFNLYAQKLSKKEAIAKAENFIKQNGFTNENFIFDSKQFDKDIVDGENIKEILAYRKGQLKSNAVYVDETEDSFVIGFEYANIDLKENTQIGLKGVVVSKKDQAMYIFHENIIVALKELTKNK